MNRTTFAWLLLSICTLGVLLGVGLLAGGSSDDGKKIFPWLPIIISTLSFLVSGYALWSTKLAPFKLEVISTGRVALTSDPHSPDAAKPAINFQLIFNNDGAQLGYVSDVAVSLRKLDAKSKPIIFRSVFNKSDDTLNFVIPVPPPKLAPFTAFSIKPGETLIKDIVFLLLNPIDEMRYEAGKYLITPYTIEAGSNKKWQRWDEMEIEVNDEDLQQLSRTTVTPNPDGSRYVHWITHSKTTIQQEGTLQKLKTMIDKMIK